MCLLYYVIQHSCKKGSHRQSLVSTVRCWNMCGRNLIKGLLSAVSPGVDTWYTYKGQDTTAGTMCWILQMLATHKDVQNRVHEEIESIFQGSDGPVTSKDLNKMKYLERVIKETLRLYPSAPLIGRYINESFEMDGYYIPAGITVGIPIYATHRDPEYFLDPEKFNPDNFLPETVAARNSYAYVPFSAGPRNCLGQKFAMLELKMMISHILRHYEIHATGDVPKPIPHLILKPENGVQIRITPRSFSF